MAESSKQYEIVTFLRTPFYVLLGVDCYLTSGAVGKRSIEVFDFYLMKFPK